MANSLAAQRENRHGLVGDGVATRLFELLWKRDLLSDTALSLRIPDTVLYKYNAPSQWFFTSVDGTIKRKSKAKVTPEHIVQEFKKRESTSAILAYFVCSVPDEVSKAAVGGNAEDEVASGTRTIVEYLDHDGLQDFLFNRWRVKPDGILQRFVEPKGDHNNMVRALWSPKVCLLERRVNRVRLSDTRYDVYERAVTFEGPDFHSEIMPVRGPGLATKVHEIADSIVQHVAAVTNDTTKVSRMALNFKVDENDRLWLLFASSVRLHDEFEARSPLGQGMCNTPLEVNTVLQVPDHVRRIRTTVTSRPAPLQQSCRCETCSQKVEPGGLWEATYKMIIEHSQRQKQVASNSAVQQENADGVPSVLQQLHPRLTLEEYTRLQHDTAFWYKTANVCEACYLMFTTPQFGAPAPQIGITRSKSAPGLCRDSPEEHEREGSDRADFVQEFFGTQALDPSRLRQRQIATLRKIQAQEAFDDEQCEEQLRREFKKKQWRPHRSPKLPSWGPGAAGAVLFPPPQVLEGKVGRPAGPPPIWAAVKHFDLAAEERKRRPNKKVPPMRGAPYLHELQAFVAQHGDRAENVLTSNMCSQLQAKIVSKARGASASAARSASTGPKAATDASQLPAEDSISAGGSTFDVNARPFPRPMEIYATAGDSESEEVSDAEPSARQKWGKWPPSTGSFGACSTPTTRTPSQGPYSRQSTRPSSTHAGSRQSTRPSSTRPSSRSRLSGQLSGGLLRSESSPQMGHGSQTQLRAGPRPGSSRPGSSPQMLSGTREQLRRPASSPQLTQVARERQQQQAVDSCGEGTPGDLGMVGFEPDFVRAPSADTGT
eukprot:gnl/TRDRNA2_/TRDRNA2_84911_c0_seq1.p1 gnl/TRDRNA2_/TRDRNA2_84911_c0~~gnl/TRDRNA2_/TRDRNA2_84911_c0_seq1.p1  ORF type:complete len:828 (+),score=147.93 gnl/TRDRNA2_/TRDRNA2_84911_c0_seq1:79-2562(+)